MNTLDGMAGNEQENEQVKKFREYIKRNFEYCVTLEKRGLGKYSAIIGTCESNHRTYSYRMKKQGRSWGEIGGKAMVKIITGLKNGDLRDAIAAKEADFARKSGKNFKNIIRSLFKKRWCTKLRLRPSGLLR